MSDSDLSDILSHLTIEELREVLNNETKFEEITKEKCDKISETGNSEKEMVLASNNSLGEYISQTAEQFQHKKMELMDLYDKLGVISEQVNSKLQQIKGQTNTVDSTIMLAQLQTAITQLEEETDNLSDKFLQGEVTIEAFIEEYINKRKLLYVRKSKLEKINDINIRRNSYKSPIRPAPAVPTAAISNLYPNSISSFPVQVPYPVGPIRMPMPGPYMPNHY